MDIAEIRKEYTFAGLRRADLHPDPIQQFKNWFQAVLSAGVDEPNAMNLATVDAEGQPSAVVNLPFDVDLVRRDDRARVLEYVARLDRRNDPIEGPFGTIHYGPPPIMRWLRWIPWLNCSVLSVSLLTLSASVKIIGR